MKLIQILLPILFTISCQTMERPPSQSQERPAAPASPSTGSDGSSPSTGKRKEPGQAPESKRPRGQHESFSVAYYLKHNPQLIMSKIQGNILDLSSLRLSNLDGLLRIPGLAYIKHINLSHNYLGEIKPGDFAGLKQLITLDLSSNSIAVLHADIFAPLENLTNLFLNDNTIREIEPNSFAGLDKLAVLSLAHNRLAVLRPKMFAGAYNLEVLDVSNNGLKSIEPLSLFSLTHLKKLKLNRNHLTQLTGSVFEGMKFIEVLDLRTNDFTEIPTTILGTIPTLQTILLTNNKIATVTRQNIAALKKAKNLKIIDLVNNRLTDAELKKLKSAIPNVEIIATVAMETTHAVEGLLGGFSAAKSLSDLEQNLQSQQKETQELAATGLLELEQQKEKSPKTMLEDEDFISRLFFHGGPYQYWYSLNDLDLTSLEGLRELPGIDIVFRIYLEHNLLQTIPANAFAGLPKLEDIELTGNLISTVDPQAFANVPLLRSVNLSNNKLHTLNPAMMPQFKNLEYLTLETSGIQSLPPFIFKDLKKLKSLYLGNNKIKEITAESLAGLENLKSLELAGNPITYLDPEILKSFKKLNFLNIAGTKLSGQNIENIKKAFPHAHILF